MSAALDEDDRARIHPHDPRQRRRGGAARRRPEAHPRPALPGPRLRCRAVPPDWARWAGSACGCRKRWAAPGSASARCARWPRSWARALVPEPLIAAVALRAGAGGGRAAGRAAGAAGRRGAGADRLAGAAGHAGGARHAGRAAALPADGGGGRFLPGAGAGGRRLALYELPAARCVPTIERTQDGGNLGTLVPNLAEGTKLSDDIGAALADGAGRGRAGDRRLSARRHGAGLRA